MPGSGIELPVSDRLLGRSAVQSPGINITCSRQRGDLWDENNWNMATMSMVVDTPRVVGRCLR